MTRDRSLSLTTSNRRRLVERLIETQAKFVMNDEEIRQGLTNAFHQLQEVKAGKRKARNAEDLLYELRDKGH